MCIQVSCAGMPATHPSFTYFPTHNMTPFLHPVTNSAFPPCYPSNYFPRTPLLHRNFKFSNSVLLGAVISISDEKAVAPKRWVTSIKFEVCRIQELATPAWGVASIKFSIRRSRTNTETILYSQVVLKKNNKWKTRTYLECGTPKHAADFPSDRANKLRFI